MLPPRQPAPRIPPSEEEILEASRRHSRRLGKLAIDASNVSWKHDEAERTARHAYGAARRDAFDRLAALNASYDAAAADTPINVTRFRTGQRNIAANMAGGVAVMAVALGLAAARPPSWTPPAPDFGTIRATISAERAVAEAIRRAAERTGDSIAAPPVDIRSDRVELIHPVWRR